MLSRESSKLIQLVTQHQDQLKQDPVFARRLMRKNIVPLVDAKGLAKGVLGKYGRQANQQQIMAFQQILTEVLIRTYAKAFTLYRNEKIEFHPARLNKKSNRAKVKAELYLSNGAPPVKLIYKLVLIDKRWLIRDLTVEGISLVGSYRSQFASQIQRYGVAETIDRFDRQLQKLKSNDGSA
ncbi:hypothetical protein DC094_05955 [Pelagibaculum spongiae]|uniref:Toluene tolerance protein n=2 Tax=Pelagibaculum spongiae TaxID=2080658 RepID=A0A2V1H1H3_9GAMM|nr:hypothetical protein DC094_05955 [Pelagibaculum spongiae]